MVTTRPPGPTIPIEIMSVHLFLGQIFSQILKHSLSLEFHSQIEQLVLYILSLMLQPD